MFEPPKYIASLIDTVNDGAKSAHLGALAFVAIGLFLLATAFSASDTDLLLERAVQISQLGGVHVPGAQLGTPTLDTSKLAFWQALQSKHP